MWVNWQGWFAVLLAPALAQGQSTWYVDVNGTPPGSGTPSDPFTSIQFAIERPFVLEGDTLLVAPGTYAERIDYLGKGLLIRSTAGAAQTTIDAGGSGSAVVAAYGEPPGTSLEGFTVTGGAGSSWGGQSRGGGAVCLRSSLSVRHCAFLGNTAELGGGLYAEAAAVLLEECSFSDGAAETAPGRGDGLGGGVCAIAGSSLVVSGGSFVRNRATSGGGIHLEDSTAAIAGVTFLENEVLSSLQRGGGVAVLGSTSSCTIDACTFERNRCPGQCEGGGLYVGGGTVTVRSSLLRGNEVGAPYCVAGGYGGGIYSEVLVRVEDTILEQNSAINGGGGIYGAGEYLRCMLRENRAHLGGAAGLLAGATLRECILSDNTALACDGSASDGGGVWGPGTLIDCEVSDNFAFGKGGGAAGGATLVGCVLRGNRAASDDYPDGGRGGGADSCTLVRCRIFENEVEGRQPEPARGGGAYGSTLSECEVFDNRAHRGGGLADCVVDRCTVYANQSSRSGGGLWASAARTVTNTIVWANVPDQLAGPLAASFCDVEGGWPGTGNFSADPRFWSEFALDFRLQPSSPCIDAGDPSRTDPDGSRLDVGAHPFDPAWCPAPLAYCTPKVDPFGCAPSISSSGSPSLSGPDDFVVRASGVLAGRTGLLFLGFQPSSAPFMGGTLCARPPLRRTPLQHSGGVPPDCTGSFAHHLSQASLVVLGLEPGDAVFAQYWYRASPSSGPQGTGLSDALHFAVCQ